MASRGRSGCGYHYLPPFLQIEKLELLMKSPFHTAEWTARIALATVFFWFGILKVFNVSPAADLVHELLEKTLPFIPYAFFIIFLGVWEALIGVLFLFPKLTHWAFGLMLIQMVTTFGPLFFLTQVTWQAPLVPTMEGQYIFKNLILLALGYCVFVFHNHKHK